MASPTRPSLIQTLRHLWQARHDAAFLRAWTLAAWPAWLLAALLILAGVFLWPAVIDAIADLLTPARVEKKFLGLVTRQHANPLRPWLELLLWGIYVATAFYAVLRLALARVPPRQPAGEDNDSSQTLVTAAHGGESEADSRITRERYVIEAELGRGAMGVVHRAEDTLLHRTVALKTLAPHLAADASLRERFLREARAVARLNHRNIVQVYDLVDSDGECRIAMEYVHGPSLAEMAARTPQPVDDIVSWGMALADALALAHAQGVVHRDIKPANIIMERASTPRLLDFGIAKLSGAAQETRLGTVLGSPAYMSPEQAAGESVDFRADIYALGIVLYELLAGTPPFTGDTSTVLAAQLTREPPPLARDDLPDGLALLIARMLAKAPADRPASMRDVHETLKQFAETPR